MDNTDKINLPDNVPNDEEHPKNGESPIRVYGPAEPVVVVYGPAAIPEPIKKEKKQGFFDFFKQKIQETEPVAVYGPAEWFEAGQNPEPIDVYGPAEWFEGQNNIVGSDTPEEEAPPVPEDLECVPEEQLPFPPSDMPMVTYGPAESFEQKGAFSETPPDTTSEE